MNRNIKYFDLDIILRRKKEIHKFLHVLKFFKDMKKEDQKEFDEQISQGVGSNEEKCNLEKNFNCSNSHFIVYLPKNYINISKIHCSTLKMDKDLLDSLKEVAPDVFENARSRITMLPIALRVSACEGEADIDTLKSEF